MQYWSFLPLGNLLDLFFFLKLDDLYLEHFLPQFIWQSDIIIVSRVEETGVVDAEPGAQIQQRVGSVATPDCAAVHLQYYLKYSIKLRRIVSKNENIEYQISGRRFITTNTLKLKIHS